MKPFIMSASEQDAPNIEELAVEELGFVSGGNGTADVKPMDHTTTCTYGQGCESDGTDDYSML